MSTPINFFKLNDEPPTWASNSVYYVKDGSNVLHYVTDANANPLLVNIGSVAEDLAELSQELAGTKITSNTTLNVPAQYADIAAAMSYLSGKRIDSSVTVTIQVADGGYNLASAVIFTHPDGSRINILGNTTTPSNCTLTATAGNALFYADNGVTTPFVDGFRLVQSGAKANIGFLVDNGAVGRLGSNVEISNFYYGIAARYGSHIEVSGGSVTDRLTVENAGDVGIWAFVGSSINCPYAYVNVAEDIPNNLGSGFGAEYGSSIQCSNGEAEGCYRAGIVSYTGSSVRAYSFNSHDNTGDGYQTILSSQITAHSGFATNNGGYGSSWDWTSIVFGSPAITYSGNALGATSGDYEIEHPLSVATANVPATCTNTTNAAANVGLRVDSDRSAPAVGDEISIDLRMSDSAGNQDTFARLTVYAEDVTSASEDGQLRFAIVSGGTLANRAFMTPTAFGPLTDGAMSLGLPTFAWQNLYGNTGFTCNIENGNWVATHTSGILTVGTGDLRVTTAGTNTASVVTVGGTQTLTNKTLTRPVLNTDSSQPVQITNTQDAASVQLLRIDGDRATPASADTGLVSIFMSDTTGTQRESLRMDSLVVDGAAASFRTQLLLSLQTGGALTSAYRFSTTSFSPITNDQLTLGTATVSWADLFLASGAVINFNNGDVTCTHSADTITWGGLTSYAVQSPITVASNTATPAGGSTSARLLFGTTAGFGIYYGSGAPTVSAAQGSLYIRSDGSSTSTRLYVNSSTGSGTTWTNFTSAT